MDQIARNNFDATMYFDKVAPAPRHLPRQSNVLPKLVLLHPPELSPSYSRVQRKPINIFKKLVPKLGTSLPQKSGYKRRGRHGDSGMKERGEQKTESWNVEWSVTPPSIIITPPDAPAFEQALSVERSPSSSVYSPQSALIEALGLAFDRVSAIEPLSYGEGVQRVKFSCSNVKPTRSQARVHRKSRYPHPMFLSPPQRSQVSPAPSKNVPLDASGHSFRRPPSSSRRTSRSLMFGHNPKKPTYTYRRQSNSAPSTPSITTPPSDIASLASISSQKDTRGQKILKRYGRCPSDFLDLGLTNPIYWPNIEQAGTDIVLDPGPARASTPLPRFDSLRSYSKASLERAMEVTEETKSVPSKASLRPKLTLQIPKTGARTVIHRPIVTIGYCKDDIKLDTRRLRPLPTIPITRQRSV